ncbi:MAG: hypothetical protein LBJ64_08670 [Deltaproteobacteria bacterium]|nr:hypothetical protein [Deltaproteobacteria bacterium]
MTTSLEAARLLVQAVEGIDRLNAFIPDICREVICDAIAGKADDAFAEALERLLASAVRKEDLKSAPH